MAHLPLPEQIQYSLVRALGRLPEPLQILLSGKKRIVVDGLTLDAQLQMILAIRARMPEKELHELPPPAARRKYRREARVGSGIPEAMAEVRDLEYPAAAGNQRARLYVPPGAEEGPLLVYYHGGGFVIGDVETHDAPCRLIAKQARIRVLSVEYRLAPEHPFPAAVEDSLAAYRWARANAAELGAEPGRIAVGGDSAGGNLSAVIAQLATAAGEAPQSQILIYPTVESITEWPSLAKFGKGYILTTEDREYFMGNYLPPGTDKRDPRVAPLLAADLSGLPPAIVLTADFDPLRDEAECYVDALRTAGNEVEHLRIAGMGHGFIHMIGIQDSARTATVQLAEAVGKIIRRAPVGM